MLKLIAEFDFSKKSVLTSFISIYIPKTFLVASDTSTNVEQSSATSRA